MSGFQERWRDLNAAARRAPEPPGGDPPRHLAALLAAAARGAPARTRRRGAWDLVRVPLLGAVTAVLYALLWPLLPLAWSVVASGMDLADLPRPPELPRPPVPAAPALPAPSFDAFTALLTLESP